MFEQNGRDLPTEKKEEEEIATTDYLFEDPDLGGVSSAAFYCTKVGQIKGRIILKEQWL